VTILARFYAGWRVVGFQKLQAAIGGYWKKIVENLGNTGNSSGNRP
jgi:hypothetical protein